MRKARYLGARSTPGSDAVPLFLAPLFPGESVAGLRLSAYGTTLTDSDVSNPNELSWYGIGIPWAIVHATNLYLEDAIGTLDTVAKWDSLFEKWLLDTSQDGDEHWGGDVDVDPERTTEEESGEDTGTPSAGEELIDSGPIGIYRWFSREVLMRPYSAAGNSTIRFGDDFEASLPGAAFKRAAFGQILMFGVVRHDVGTETNFNVELDDDNSREGMGIMMSGDYSRVRAKIEGDTGTVGDYIRTTLFGGDNYVEASTIVADTAKMNVKATLYVDSPLQRQRR